MKVLFDTNVVLDVLLERQPHVEAAARLFALLDSRRLEGSICATTVATVFYIASRSFGAKRAQALVRDLLALFDVAGVDRDVLTRALDLGFADFKDAVLHEAARAGGMAAIVTRDGKDFAHASLAVFDPYELLAAIAAAAQ
ncbi:MAG: PIN domain-containing protein [Thermoleophilia bacterium]